MPGASGRVRDGGWTVKEFTSKDVRYHPGSYGRIYADPGDLVNCPLPWQRAGLQQTASGYGARLTTDKKINYGGRLYRLYATCYSNAASVWFTVKGVRI